MKRARPERKRIRVFATRQNIVAGEAGDKSARVNEEEIARGGIKVSANIAFDLFLRSDSYFSRRSAKKRSV